MNERELIEQIRQLTGAEADGLVQGIGDDCAVIVKDEENVWLLTMDTLIESVHFDCSWHPPELLGRKAVAVNVSDIAAMGGRPLFVLLSLGLPKNFAADWATALSRGIAEACRCWGCLLVGGDTVCSPDKAMLTLAVIGEMKRAEVLYRHGAQLGDTVWVSGPLGLSAAGLALLQAGCRLEACPAEWRPLLRAHLVPQPKTELAAVLAQSGLVHAMMDLSDGIATDLAHLCAQSNAGARLRAEQLPGRELLAPAAALLGHDPLAWMLSGGEDYELLFTAPPSASEQLQQLAAAQQCSIYPVGTISAGQGVVLVRDAAGDSAEEENISYQGFDHFQDR